MSDKTIIADEEGICHEFYPSEEMLNLRNLANSAFRPPAFISRPPGEHERCSVDFAMKLFTACSETYKNSSFVISPLTTQTTFGMCFTGSDCYTKKELSQKIFNWNPTAGVYLTKLAQIGSEIDALRTVTRLYCTHRAVFYPGYEKKVRAILDKEQTSWSVDEVNFETGDLNRLAAVIDEFVGKKLDGWESTTPALTPDGFFDAETRLLAVQGFCYATKWRIPFSSASAPISEYNAVLFVKSPGQEPALIECMQQKGTFRFFEDSHWKVLRKATSTKNLSVYFMLPMDEVGRQDLRLRFDYYTELVRYFRQCVSQKVKVVLPKFNLEAPWHDFSEPLKRVGVTETFKRMRANLCHMASVADLENGFGVTKLIQKYTFQMDEGIDENPPAVIEESDEKLADEDGSGDSKPMATFIADRPLLFFLVYEDAEMPNMIVLLAGRYCGPE